MAKQVKARKRTKAALMREGFAALIDKLGIADAIRFVQMHRPGEGDYTRDRHAWLDSMTVEEVNRLMAAASRKPASKRSSA